MKYPCELIKDLLPLYHDGVCSKETTDIVKEHLLECCNCKQYYNLIKDSDNLTIEKQNEEQEKANMLKSLNKKLIKKKYIISLISIVFAMFIMISVFAFMNNYIIPIEYKDHNITVTVDNGDLCANIKGIPYLSAESKTIVDKRNGKEEHNIYFYVSSSFWAKNFNFNSSIQSKYVIAYDYISDQQKSGADSINNIYYYVGNYNNLENLSGDELKEATNNAVLIWNKSK